MPYQSEERSVGAEIKSILDDLIDDFPSIKKVVVEPRDREGKVPDLVIFDANDQPICAIEIKLPTNSPYHPNIFNQAFGYANNEGLEYFGTFNLQKLVIWKTFEEGKPLLQRRFKEYDISEVEYPEDFEKKYHKEIAKENFKNVLTDLRRLQIEETEKVLPSLPPDRILIDFLHSTIDSISKPITERVVEKIGHSPSFRKKIKEWYVEQGWQWTSPKDIGERTARQYALLLTNKIIFYDVLRSEYDDLFTDEEKELKDLPNELPPLQIPKSITDGGLLQSFLQGYFEKVLDIDYNTIYSKDFFHEIGLPTETVNLIRSLTNEFEKYNFSELDYEIIGNIFEKMIPPEDRHKFGQYFTRSDVVDLIVGSSIYDKEDVVFDPACGAGTFLIRAYSRLKYLGFNGAHRELLKKLWGGDIAKFPAHLTTINLVTRDLSERENFPRIASNQDFFDIGPNSAIVNSSFTTEGLNSEEMERDMPNFDALVTNPPYTRQEEIEDKIGEGYKNRIRDLVQQETNGVLNYVSKRHSIYSYFFLHGSKFIKENGRIGMITSNSWLDVDYGKDLQQYFLKKFKIKAIIESSVERFFEDADVNTVITILEKNEDFEENKNNSVKFIQLREELSKVFEKIRGTEKPYQEWNDEERWEGVDKFLEYIDNTNTTRKKDHIRIFPKSQKELWEEGYDKEEESYVGSKWGKYLRAPDIFFDIIERKSDNLAPLGKFSEINFGVKTGANEFFYMEEDKIKEWEIEDEYLIKVIKSPRDCPGILVDEENAKKYAIFTDKSIEELEETNLYNYINWGEKQGYNQRPTCSSRDPWYSLPEVRGDLACMMSINTRHIFWYNKKNALIDARMYGITLKEKYDSKVLSAILNSSLTPLFVELWGRLNLGEGALDVKVYEYEKIPIPDLEKIPNDLKEKIKHKFSKIFEREMGSVFEELGSETPSKFELDGVKEDRRELDEVIMGELLGLSIEEQKRVYKSVLNLVKNRIDKAKSVDQKENGEELETTVEELKELVLYSVKNSIIEKAREYEFEESEEKKIEEEGIPSIEMNVQQETFLKVNDRSIKCKNPLEAKYIRFKILSGEDEIEIPKDKQKLEDIVNKFENADKEINQVIENTMDLLSAKEGEKERLKKEIYLQVWRELFGGS